MFFQSSLGDDRHRCLRCALAAHEAILAGRGWTGRSYNQQRFEREALGFGLEETLVRPTQGPPLVESLRDHYQSWAEMRLAGDEDNVAGFCSFLSTRAGKPLRFRALVWIADELRGHSEVRSWHRDRTSAAFVDFLGTVLTEDGTAAVATANTKEALMDLVGLAVSGQLTAASALQDRLKALL
ncbi:hypothetical protein [Bradyrhizobium sp. F1.13.3]|uniref:hypothetical protein n=1 Tax=Bradyrhizobium sp. F1.13.3 TaxID=3156351 RepID=UPI0033994BC6